MLPQLIVLFIVLVILQSLFSNSLFKLLFLLTKSQIMATKIFSVIMLPGTILHELSHWLVAEILQVPTGRFDYMPKVEGNSIRMGSLQIAKVDPFRRTLVGLAPMISGIITIVILVSILTLHNSPSTPLAGCLLFSKERGSIYECVFNNETIKQLNNLITYQTSYVSSFQNILIIWLIFIISNTMFSSRKDLEAVIVPAILSLFGFFVWWMKGLKGLDWIILNLNPFIVKLNSVLLLVIILDLLMIIFVKLLTLLSGKLLGRRIVQR